MRVDEVIARVDEMKPNLCDEDLKISWLDALEKRIYENVIKRREGASEITVADLNGENKDTELIVPDEYAELYVFYLLGKIDYKNQETDLYMNDSAMFNQAYQEFADYWTRNHASTGVDRFKV